MSEIPKILKSGDIIIFKGGKWSKLLKYIISSADRNMYLTRTLISMMTLSRYVHTATVVKEKEKWYIIQSLLHDGICKQELYMPWLQKQIDENVADIFRQENFNKKKFDKNLTKFIGRKYPVWKLINIGVYNLTGFEPMPNIQKDRHFCSETTCLLHEINVPATNGVAKLTSPADLAHSDELKRIL